MKYLVNIENYSIDEIGYIFEKAECLKYYQQMQFEHHIPVLLQETLDLLSPKDGEVYVDCTFGAGGHTRAILQSADCKVIALDRDPFVKTLAEEFEKEFGDRFVFAQSKFSGIDQVLRELEIDKVDGIIMDLGFSSMQVDTPRRGFSFQADGPLDMRMGVDGLSAEDFVNDFSEEEIANVIFKLGDERKSRAIAKSIIQARAKARITRTSQLAEIIADATGHYSDSINPATRSFQAIRIFINDEFEELKSVLQKSKDNLKENGRLVVISFHSGEDVIVKDFFKNITGAQNQGFSRYSLQGLVNTSSTNETNLVEFEFVNSKPIIAGDEELKINPRSRSAKIRAVRKLKFAS